MTATNGYDGHKNMVCDPNQEGELNGVGMQPGACKYNLKLIPELL